jgi:hypothetical protein
MSEPDQIDMMSEHDVRMALREEVKTTVELRNSLSAAQAELVKARPKNMVITCECERGPREVIEHTDDAGVSSWALASHCSDCFEDGSAIVYTANAQPQGVGDE